MTNNQTNFRNTLTAIVGAVLMTTTTFAIAVSPARAAVPAAATAQQA